MYILYNAINHQFCVGFGRGKTKDVLTVGYVGHVFQGELPRFELSQDSWRKMFYVLLVFLGGSFQHRPFDVELSNRLATTGNMKALDLKVVPGGKNFVEHLRKYPLEHVFSDINCPSGGNVPSITSALFFACLDGCIK